MVSDLAEMVRRRNLLIEIIATDLRQREAGTLLGPVWWLLDPLILMLTYWMLVKVIGYGGQLEAFPVFLLCGLLPAKYITGSVASSSALLTRRRSLILAYPFPTVYLPLANVLSNLVFFVVSLPLLGLMGMLIFDRRIDVQAVQLVLLIVPMTVLTVGLSMLASALGAMVRDLSNVIAYTSRILIYASPVMYGLDRIRNMMADIGEEGRLGELLFILYQMNPLALCIEVIRGSVYEPHWVAWQWWAVLSAESLAAGLIGLWVYRRCERRVMKYI